MNKKVCCKALDMVTARVRENDRIGLMREHIYSLRKRWFREAVVIRCRKSKDRKADFADATFFVVNYCPFCGKRLEKMAKENT